MRVLVGRCYEERSGTAFSPFVEVLTTAWSLASPALRAAAVERFGELGRLVPELLSVPARSEGPEAGLRVLRTVAAFLTALAREGPLALALDDLHWADGASLELLAHLARSLRGERVLLLGTYGDVEVGRQHPLEATVTALTRDRVADVLVVRGLPPAGTAALIRDRCDVATVTEELRDLVHERTEGNPFFTEEVLRALLEQGTAGRSGDGWDRAALEHMTVPQSVRSAVGQRLGRLVPEAQALLRQASVLGQEFELPVLVGAAEQTEAAVLEHLEAALALKVLQERRAGRGERYAFTHQLIAQTLYEEVPRFRLRRLHLRAGEALERERGQRPEMAGELAAHFLAAGDDARAARYAIQAGDHAAGVYAARQAEEQYRTALDLLLEQERMAEAAEVRLKLGRVLHDLGRREEALAALALALHAFEQLGDCLGRARAHRDIAWVHQFAYDTDAAAPHLDAALALWPPEQENAEFARLLLDAARAAYFSGDRTAAAALGARGLALAEQLGESAVRARALLELTFVQLGAGTRPQEIIARLDEAEPAAHAAGDAVLLARIWTQRANAHCLAGDFAAAYADHRRALAADEQTGRPAGIAIGSLFLAGQCYLAGDWAEGRALLHRAQAVDPDEWPQDVAVLLATMTGDRDSARGLLHDAVATARQRGDRRVVALQNWLFDLAWRMELEGRFGEAEALARELVGLQATGMANVDIALLALVLARRRHPDAARVLAQAGTRVERDGTAWNQPTLARARGLLLASRGDGTGAVTALRNAADLARASGNMLELGPALADLAAVAREQAATHLAVAADAERLDIVERIGPEVRRLGWRWTSPTA